MPNQLPDSATDESNSDNFGTTPEINSRLENEVRSVSSVAQAYAIIETMVADWEDGIKKAARITAKLNGERPYNQSLLKKAGKGHKTNISTRFLATECNRVVPRFFMPIKTARYLTAAALPANWPDGLRKTEIFREAFTEKIRSWPKFNFYIRGLAREVGIFGFAFNVFFDEYSWQPTLIRMDRGFVPKGTEVLEEPSFFLAKYNYRPDELLELLKRNIDGGRTEWKKKAVVNAINHAAPPDTEPTDENARSYEELLRQSAVGYSYQKGANLVETYHLFAKETSGKVSHYVFLANVGSVSGADRAEAMDGNQLLYENMDQYESISDAVHAMVFDYGDGTIHGSWGAGAILYDLAAMVEKIRCDSMDNLRNTNKIKANVPDATKVNDVKLLVDDEMMVVSGAQFAGNSAAMGQEVNGYEALDQKLASLAQQQIGSFIPPIPLQPSDIKATQINAAISKEREIQEALLENWLIQWAYLAKPIAKRLCMKGSPDKDAKEFRKHLLEKGLTEEEIQYLAERAPVQSVMEFTEYKTQQKALFAANILGNPLFRQNVAARTMAAGAGDLRFVDEIVVPEGDQSEQMEAARLQLMENAAMALGQPVPVLPKDNDWVHMQTMEPGLLAAIESNQAEIAQVGLQHYAAHYEQGVAKKTIPKEEINQKKSLIAALEKRIGVIVENQLIEQQKAQAQATAEAEAQRIISAELAGGIRQVPRIGQTAQIPEGAFAPNQ